MSVRRKSARLAMAVSSILAAPAIATGLGVFAALAVAPEARAQETSSQISGVVVDADGNPVANAQVVIVHVPSGSAATATSNAGGQFTASGLRVGGPFTVTSTASGYEAAAVENVYTELGRRASVTLSMFATAQLAEIEVTGQSIQAAAIGVSTEFTADKIAAVPAIERDPKGTLRIDPKAWIDATNSDALEVAGVNNRYNSLTVDGVRQSDDFGLNNNGYPTQRSPISIDAIEQLSLLSAPFDVQYSSFRGSTINIVTKSGTNEFSGSAFYYKYDDSLVGDKSRDRELDFSFDRETYGATLGGPIIQDKLFFFLSYENLDETNPQDTGPTGSGFPVEVQGVTQAEFDQVVSLAQSVYGYDAGGLIATLPEEDEKILAKIDWNITDGQRASLSYQRTEGNEIITQNISASFRDMSASSDWYNRGILLESYALQLYSDWSPIFSTELKLARKEVETLQQALGGTEFANMRITTPSGGEMFIGADVFRHANVLTNDLDQIKLKGDLFLGDHTLSVGYEREMLDIFNQFVPRSLGEYYFNSITDFQNRQASRLTYSNAFTNDSNDGAAAFSYDVDSLYVQDRWQVTPEFELQFGLRFEKFSSDDEPLFNQNFFDRYGFSNQETLDGRDLLMPRLGFSWQVADQTLLRGGFGLFGGGTPNVWVSNSFSNDGVTIVQQDIRRPAAVPPATIGVEPRLDNVDGFNIPAQVQADQTGLRGDGAVNAITPDFEVPSQWRVNLGLEHYFENDWRVSTDIIYSEVKDEVIWRDLRLQQTDTAPDGRPIYTPADGRASFIQDIVLGNTSEGKGLVWTVDLSKQWVTAAGTFDIYTGYGFQDIEDVNPGTSSTASSNWDNLATEDPNNPSLSTSNYEIKHRFTAALNWKKAFFKDAFTSAGLFVERRSGRPYSYTFARGTTIFGDPRQASRQRHLFYVPDVNDPNVVYSTPEFGAAVNAFIEESELRQYRGQIAPRNAFFSPWVTTMDLRLAQEIPLGVKDLRAILTLDIENLTNLINDDWGRLAQVSFPYVAPVLDASINAQGQYVYRPVAGETEPQGSFKSLSALPSVWRVQLGFRIEF